MRSSIVLMDRFLAAAVRGEPAIWSSEWGDAHELAAQRAIYHGISGLLVDRFDRLVGWPAALLAELRAQAVAQTMWELRHRAVLRELVAGFRAAQVDAVFLKGTALAYDVYPTPAARARGDTDLLVRSDDQDKARQVLRGFGFRLDPNASEDPTRLQEPWTWTAADGGEHAIDLHWRVLNSAALSELFRFDDVLRDSRSLSNLAEGALGPSRSFALLHACVHRAQHVVAPYIVDGVLHYGGDRLIWLYDIELLARSLTAQEWISFNKLAIASGVAVPCADALRLSKDALGTRVPDEVSRSLAFARATDASTYLSDARQVSRAWRDFLAVPGVARKAAHLRWRLFPPAQQLRLKYRDGGERWLITLHLRRLRGFLGWRGKTDDRS